MAVGIGLPESNGSRLSVIRSLILLLGLLLLPALVHAVEIVYVAPAMESPPQRRLTPDPARPAGAATSLDIEYAAIRDDANSALGLAQRAFEASERAYGKDDPRLIIPLTNLGFARQRAGQARLAVADFRRAIELAAALPSPRDLRLAEAHYGLGVALHELGVASSAIAAFENGLEQHRVGRGLYSVEQIDFLRALAVSNRSLARVKDAAHWQTKRVKVAEQALAANSESLAWNYVSAGRWFRDIGDHDQALALHRRAVEVIERERGADDALLIGPLMDLTLTGSMWTPTEDSPNLPSRFAPGATLSRAYRLAMAGGAGKPEEQAQTLERVGDMNWLFGRRREALRAYARAEELSRGSIRPLDFGAPAFLVFRAPGLPQDWDQQQGHLLAEFSVDSRGRARDVEIVEGLPPELVKAVGPRLTSALKASRLRPRLDGGRPTATEEVRYRMVLTPAKVQGPQQQG